MNKAQRRLPLGTRAVSENRLVYLLVDIRACQASIGRGADCARRLRTKDEQVQIHSSRRSEPSRQASSWSDVPSEGAQDQPLVFASQSPRRWRISISGFARGATTEGFFQEESKVSRTDTATGDTGAAADWTQVHRYEPVHLSKSQLSQLKRQAPEHLSDLSRKWGAYSQNSSSSHSSLTPAWPIYTHQVSCERPDVACSEEHRHLQRVCAASSREARPLGCDPTQQLKTHCCFTTDRLLQCGWVCC